MLYTPTYKFQKLTQLLWIAVRSATSDVDNPLVTTVGTLTADEGFPFVVGTVGTVGTVAVKVSDDEVGMDVALVVVDVDDAAASVVTCTDVDTDDDCTELTET